MAERPSPPRPTPPAPTPPPEPLPPNPPPVPPEELVIADLSRTDLLHPVDGWHASVEGHNALAEGACRDLKTSFDFLGIQ